MIKQRIKIDDEAYYFFLDIGKHPRVIVGFCKVSDYVDTTATPAVEIEDREGIENV